MVPTRTFLGTEDIRVWLTDFDTCCRQAVPGVTDTQKLQMVMACLSPEVKGCCKSVAEKIELVTGAEWVQTWPRLRATLIGVNAQIQLLGKEKSWERTPLLAKGLLTTSGGLAASVVFPMTSLGVLTTVGFGAGGLLAGSPAAAIQSSIALVKAANTVIARTAALAAADNNATLKELRVWESQSPSDSWSNGEFFAPSLAVVLLVVLCGTFPEISAERIFEMYGLSGEKTRSKL